MNTGESIRYWRNKKGLTQKELADASGISEISIRKYEANDRVPKINTIISIACALEIGIFDLISVKEYRDKINQETHDKIQADIESGKIHVISEGEQKLMDDYQKLNEIGQNKAIEQIELLTKVPEYQKNPKE